MGYIPLGFNLSNSLPKYEADKVGSVRNLFIVADGWLSEQLFYSNFK